MWNCPACGCRGIAASLTGCPMCGRDREMPKATTGGASNANAMDGETGYVPAEETAASVAVEAAGEPEAQGAGVEAPAEPEAAKAVSGPPKLPDADPKNTKGA